MNLWGDEYIVESTQTKSKRLLEKVKNPKQTKKTQSSKLSTEDKILLVKENVHKILGKYAESTIVIKTKEEFDNYIDNCIATGVVALDTETNNSLDPLTCKLMGLCVYSPGLSAAYIPVNHVNITTGERLDWQLTEEDIRNGILKLNQIKIITHNGKFDYEVIKCTCDCEFKLYWDSQIAAKVLNENESSARLKDQYKLKIDANEDKYSIEHLFEHIEYAVLDTELFALYAATDAYKTYKLYEWQLEQLSKSENADLLDLLMNVEFPVITITAEMELTGVCLDLEYAERLKKKYQVKLDELQIKVDEELKKYDEVIAKWRLTEEANIHPKKSTGIGYGKSKSEQLDTPVNLASPIQLAILLYDVLKIDPPDKKHPRGTGEEVLLKMNNSLCNVVLEHRRLMKLVNTYVEKLPECISEKDGRLHASFNQYGAATGRFSSSEPNLQNIPSHENSIRMLFTASPGYVMLGGDYSQQEPRLLAHYSDDENMISAYEQNKDLYAMIASKVYNNDYEDNKEFRPDGSINPEGKKRRTSVKSLLLGIMYGMQTPAIAEQLGCSIKEAESIKAGFFKEFPKVNNWINETQDFAKKYGYVSDAWGRRRRLPDIQRPRYEVKYKNSEHTFNPLLGSSGVNPYIKMDVIQSYLNKLDKCKSRKEADQIIAQAHKENLIVYNNTGFVSQAERQCVNARIQGGAASMSKRAMINVYNNEELKRLGFRLLIVVHDELIGECPEENKEECKKLLSQMMLESAKPQVQVPMKCDVDDFKSWYQDVYSAEIQKEYKDYLTKYDDITAFELVKKNHIESTENFLQSIVYN